MVYNAPPTTVGKTDRSELDGIDCRASFATELTRGGETESRLRIGEAKGAAT